MFSNIFKVAYLVVIYFLLSTFTFAQDNWTWLNPKPMGSTILSSGYFPGTNIIIAVGANGLIMRSTDNGSNWSHIQSNLTSGFNTVAIVNSALAYVAGDGATILKTSDAGQSWTTVITTDISDTIAQLQFVSETTGFLRMGNSIYKTVNGGINWISIVTNNTGWLTTFCAISETKLFFGTTSGDYFSASQSGGWTPVLINTFTTESNFRQVKTIVANGSNIAVFSDLEQIRLSSDAGITWASPISGNTGMIFACATFISGNDLVAASTAGVIITSVDGGLNWSPASVETSSGVNCISSNSSNNIILLGANGVQYNSTNAGLTWVLTSNSYTSSTLFAIFAKDENEIYVGGRSGTLLKTTDGGSTWTSIKPLNAPSDVTDIKLDAVNKIYFTTASGLIYSSTNGGTTWISITPSNRSLQEISFGSSTQGVACGINNGATLTVFYTEDGGSTWTASSGASASTPFYSAFFVPGTQKVYIAGGSGRVNKSLNAGKNWTAATSAGNSTLNSIFFVSDQIGYVVGNGGYIAKTIDGATSWTQKSQELTSADLQSIRFFDNQNGIVVGTGGTILKTTDGGETWVKSAVLTELSLYSASLYNSTTTFAAGSSGTIIKSTNAPLPVELTTFTAAHKNGIVTLNWETKTEIDNYGFEIERKSSATGWQKIGFVEGHFTTNSPKYYNFTDRPNGTGKIQYRLKQIDNDGSFEYSHIAEVFAGSMPNGYLLEQNYPNPFNPSTTIGFTTRTTGFVKLVVYNPLGETVKVLFSDIAEAGRYYKLEFDATGLNSGVYFYRLEAENFKTIKKLTLVK